MKLKYLLISLLLIKNCYAEESSPSWVIPLTTTFLPTTYPTSTTYEYNGSNKRKKQEEIRTFVKNSYDKLEIEIAKGEGLYLDQLIDLTSSMFYSKEEKINFYREELNKILQTNPSKESKIEKLSELAVKEKEK